MLAGNNPEAQQKALEAANKGWDRPPSPTPTNGGSASGFTSTPSTPSTGFGGAPLGGNTASTSFAPAASWGTSPIATTAGGKAIVPASPQPEL
jgi:hypothetical protein